MQDDRIIFLKSILSYSKNFIRDAENALLRVFPDRYRKITAAVDQLETAIESLTGNPLTFVDYLREAAVHSTAASAARIVIDTVTDASLHKMIVAGKSTLYSNDVLAKNSIAVQAYHNYMRFKPDISKFLSTHRPDELLASIESMPASDLTREVCAAVIDADDSLAPRAISYLEKSKSEYLRVPARNPDAIRVTRGGLIPVTLSMHIARHLFAFGYELAKSFNGTVTEQQPPRSSPSAHKTYRSAAHLTIEQVGKAMIAERPFVGVIFVTNTSTSPVEFDSRGLVDQKYVQENGLETTSTTGLNKKVLRRLATTIRLPRGSANIHRVVTYADSPTRWYVLESITDADSELSWWRVLGKPVSGPDTALTAAEVQCFLLGESTRPERYNELQSDTIIANSRDPRHELTTDAYSQAKLIPARSSDVIRSRVLDFAKSRFRDQAPKSFRDLTRFDNDDSKAYSDAIYEILADDFSAGDQLASTYTTRNDKYKLVERRFSQIGRIEDIVSGFMQQIIPKLYTIPRDIFARGDVERAYLDAVSAAIDVLEKNAAWIGFEMTLKEFANV